MEAVNEKIVAQGNKIREMKSSKADKAAIKAEVDSLLALKAEFKKVAGKDWKPGVMDEPKPQLTEVKVQYQGGGLSEQDKKDLENAAAEGIDIRIQNCGDFIRKLKSEKAEKAKVEEEVKVLLFLKQLYKNKAGADWIPPKAPTPTTAISATGKNRS